MILDPTDVPQADKLDKIRALVDAVHNGHHTIDAMGQAADLSRRHVAYYLHATRVLGFVEVEGESKSLTAAGLALIATAKGSQGEATAISKAVLSCHVVRQVAGDLLQDEFSEKTVGERIRVLSGLSQSTAQRRAHTIAAWRQTIRSWTHDAQAPLPRNDNAQPKRLDDGPPAAKHTPDVRDARDVATRASAPSAPLQPESLISPPHLAYLADQIARGKLSLFTGAGFSMDARDINGRGLPSGAQLAEEIWKISYPNEEFERDSSLADLFFHASRHRAKELDKLLRSRFTVDSNSLPSHYATWLALPWRSAYTLNVDDLAEAAARHFKLPRIPVPRSALDRAPERRLRQNEFEIVHLNGRMTEGITRVTFDVAQYSRRLADQEPAYSLLSAELLAFPFIFVGSVLDESIFWQHIELRGQRGQREHEMRPRCFLVTPHLSRARRDMLHEYNIVWIPCRAGEFATSVLSKLSSEYQQGHESLKRALEREADQSSNVHDVATLVSAATRGKTEFLSGAEPTWADLLDGRAIARSSDEELVTQCKRLLNAPQRHASKDVDTPASVVLVTGTAGAGKSTSLMRAAIALSGEGVTVSWVGRETQISPRGLRDFWSSEDAPNVLVIDDADRYGGSLGPLLGDLSRASGRRLILLALRASKVDRTLDAADIPPDVPRVEISVPLLSDHDIEGLLEVLSRENRLGRLTGKPMSEQVAAFREQAGRQLLVAMIQATSGRKFDEKVLEEWSDLSDDKRQLYTLIALATSLRYQPTKSEVLLASGSPRAKGVLKALNELVARHIVVEDKSSQRYAARHRVIAERLVDGLASNGQQLVKPLANLAFSVSSQLSPRSDRQNWSFRFLKTLMNNDYLYRMCELEGARAVYDSIEENVNWDHHFWLQRGSLEVKNGDVRKAEQWLDTARSLNPNDAYVTTEFAYMLLRKAISTPEAGEAQAWVDEALTTLRAQITARGRRDAYPYHILGMQGLGWAQKARMSKPDKKVFLSGLLSEVRDGATKHPHTKELRELRDLLQHELLALEVRG